MGFSAGIIKSCISVGRTPLMLVFVLMTCCAASGDYVAAALAVKVYNNLKYDALMVLSLPGCCFPCGPNPPKGTECPYVYVQCSDVIVEAMGAAMLGSYVGPYPMPYLAVQLKEKVWCMEESALKLMKPRVTLEFGPGGCDPLKRGLDDFVRHRDGEKPLDVLLPVSLQS